MHIVHTAPFATSSGSSEHRAARSSIQACSISGFRFTASDLCLITLCIACTHTRDSCCKYQKKFVTLTCKCQNLYAHINALNHDDKNINSLVKQFSFTPSTHCQKLFVIMNCAQKDIRRHKH